LAKKEVNWKNRMLGVVAVVVLLLPNIINVIFPPLEYNITQKSDGVIKTIVEWGSRMIILVYPAICGVKIREKTKSTKLLLILMGICLAFYWAFWIGYVFTGQSYAFLFRPYWGFFIPLAMFPTIYFVCLGLYMQSYVMTIASVVFLIFHNWISLGTWSQIVTQWKL